MPEKLKKGWTRVAFGDVIRQVRDRVDPEDSGIERYIAGEHMDTDDLRLSRWGLIGNGYLGPAFNMRFKPGQVLYGSRRTYLRKVAVADFEGITANTTFVLESKNPKVLLPEILPFIMQTESFHEHSIKQSKGSVNPYINFSDLTWYEFALPPLEEQQRIAVMMLASQAVIENLQNTAQAADTLYIAASMRLFSRPDVIGVSPRDWLLPGWSCKSLESLVLASAPICYGIVQVKDHNPAGVPTLAIRNIGGDFSTGIHCTHPAIEAQYSRSRVEPDDFLLSIKATIGEAAIVPHGFRGNISRDLARLRFNPAMIRVQYFLHLYRSPRFKRYVNSLIVGSTRSELSIAAIRKMEVPLPPIEEQDRIIGQMGMIFQAKMKLANRVQQAFQLNRQIINMGFLFQGGQYDL